MSGGFWIMATTVGKWREVDSSRMVPEKENLMK